MEPSQLGLTTDFTDLFSIFELSSSGCEEYAMLQLVPRKALCVTKILLEGIAVIFCFPDRATEPRQSLHHPGTLRQVDFVSKPFLHWEKDPLFQPWDTMDQVYPTGFDICRMAGPAGPAGRTLHPAVLNFLGCSDHTFRPVDNLTSLLSQRMIKLK